MNKIDNLDFKLEQLDSLFNKIVIKTSLNITNRTGYPLALGLVREEVQKIICVSVLVELRIVFHSLAKSYSKNIDIKFLVDIIFKILLISCKQKIVSKLSLRKDNRFVKLNFFNSWLLKDLELRDYYLFLVILNWLVVYPTKKNSMNLVESLIENFIIKFSDIMIYELFYESSLPKVFFVEYTVDFLVFVNSFEESKFNLYFRRVIERIYFLLIKKYNFDHSILICGKNGFVLKSLQKNYIVDHIKINQAYTPILEVLNFLASSSTK